MKFFENKFVKVTTNVATDVLEIYSKTAVMIQNLNEKYALLYKHQQSICQISNINT